MARDWTQEEFGITNKTPIVDIDALENKCERLQKQLAEANTIILLCKKAYMFPEETMKFLCTYIKKWELDK